MKAIKWYTLECKDGSLTEYAYLGKFFTVYVDSSGNWKIVRRKDGRNYVKSNHQTRGTSMPLGKNAVTDYINRFIWFQVSKL